MSRPTEQLRWKRIAILGLVAIAALLPYLGSVTNEWAGDDEYNAMLEADVFLAGEPAPGTSGDGGAVEYLLQQNLQRSLVLLTFVGRYALFGDEIVAWRAFQLLFHVLNAWLVLAVANRLGMARRLDSGRYQLGAPGPILAALLYAWSMAAGQSIDWVGGTYDLFTTTGLGLALLGHTDRRAWLTWLGCVVAFTSKETGLMVLPALGMWHLATERWEGWLPTARRFAVPTLIILVLSGLRALQVKGAGSVESAGLPLRTVGLNVGSLLGVGPTTLLAGLLAPMRRIEAWIDTAALIGGGLVVVGLAARRSTNLTRRVVGILAGAWWLMVPVLSMAERGAHLTAEEIFFNSRYLCTAMLMLAPIVPLICFGRVDGSAPSLLRRAGAIMATAAFLLTFDQAIDMASHLPRNDGLVRTTRTTLAHADAAPGSRLWVLMVHPDPPTEALLLSGWWMRWVPAETIVVQPGTWSMRARIRRVFLDREGTHVRTLPGRFEASRISKRDQLWSVAPRRSSGRVLRIDPSTIPSAGSPVPVTLDWSSGRSGVCIDRLAGGGARFRECPPGVASGDPSGGGVRTQELNWPAHTLAAFELEYSVVGGGENAVGEDILITLVWHALDQQGKATELRTSFRAIPDGTRRTETLMTWLEPQFGSLQTVRWLGLEVSGGDGELTLHRAAVSRTSAQPAR